MENTQKLTDHKRIQMVIILLSTRSFVGLYASTQSDDIRFLCHLWPWKAHFIRPEENEAKWTQTEWDRHFDFGSNWLCLLHKMLCNSFRWIDAHSMMISVRFGVFVCGFSRIFFASAIEHTHTDNGNDTKMNEMKKKQRPQNKTDSCFCLWLFFSIWGFVFVVSLFIAQRLHNV